MLTTFVHRMHGMAMDVDSMDEHGGGGISHWIMQIDGRNQLAEDIGRYGGGET